MSWVSNGSLEIALIFLLAIIAGSSKFCTY